MKTGHSRLDPVDWELVTAAPKGRALAASFDVTLVKAKFYSAADKRG